MVEPETCPRCGTFAVLESNGFRRVCGPCIPLVRHPAGDDAAARQARAEALCQLIRGECEQFLRSPRDQDLYRVLHRTYFEPSVKQRAAADELGLSFITYRRYLAAAVRRLADRLWQRQSAATP